MRTILPGIAAGLAICTTGFAQELPQLDDILADLDANAAGAESLRFDFSATTSSGSSMEGTVASKGAQSYAEFSANMTGQESQMKMVSQGETQWIEMHTGGAPMVMKIDAKVFSDAPEDVRAASMIDAQQGASQFIQDPRNSWRRMSKVFDLSLTGEGERGGDPVWIIEGGPKDGETVSAPSTEIASARFEIGKEDGYPRFGAFYLPDGQAFMTVEMSNLALNAEVDEAIFEYTPPEGVQPMDLTPMIKQQLTMLENPEQPAK